MITIIGTNHISHESLKLVEKAKAADIMALELDRGRLQGLLTNQKTSKSPKVIGQIGVAGYLFLVIGGAIQQKLGKMTGLNPGSEMLHAYKIAKDNGMNIALIDQDFRITMKKFSNMKARHKLKLFKELFRPAPKELRFNPTSIPNQQIIEIAMKYMKQRLPEMYKILVDDRNHVMAKRLAYLQFTNPDKHVAAVLGAGHVQEVAQLSKNYLKKLQEG